MKFFLILYMNNIILSIIRNIQVLDYTQYYLDLSAANLLGEPTWQSEYNLTSYYYGLGEVTSVALHNLADRFTNPEDPLFAK